MEFLVLDEQFNTVDTLDTFESAIWTDRYNECGDFEIYTPINKKMQDMMQENYYLWNNDSEHVMIIETNEIETDSEEGRHLLTTGRSLESILDRRIIWKQTTLSGSLQNGIKTLINDSIINPSDSSRKISNFIFEETTDPDIVAMTVDAQYTGDNLYDVICDMCQTKEIGFKITLNDRKQFVFKLYKGEDRSYLQSKNPYVVFSPNFDNISDSKYIESMKTLKNVTLVAGEEQGESRKTYTVGSGSGLGRRELFTDARDISSKQDDVQLSDSQYNELLKQRGLEKLNENKVTKTFEGAVDSMSMYIYGIHFFLGDITQIVNEFNKEERCRVTEMVMSQDDSGYTAYPSFTILQNEQGE